MAKYDLSSQRAIEDSARLATERAGNEPNQGSYNAAWLHGYAEALKDCWKGLEYQQGLLDNLLNYLGEHMDSSELRRMFYEDMGMSEKDVAFLGFDLDEGYEELDGEIEDISDVEYMMDFGNGFQIQKIFANKMPDGSYGDIYDFPSDVRKEHPNAQVMVGYCVVDIGAGIVPHGCNDWNNTVAEAEADYEENVVPCLDEEFDEISDVEYVKDFGNGYMIQTVFANRLPDGMYGDVYDSEEATLRDHPNARIMFGYCVVHVGDGMIPDGCNDWNDTVEEAIADYEENVVPYLDKGFAQRPGAWGPGPGKELPNSKSNSATIEDLIDIVVESWEDMKKKYPMIRDEMSEEEERAFVEDCFKLYEQEGFSPRYWSPFTDNAERIGQKVEIIGRCAAGEDCDLEVLPMWKARLEDGTELDVYPEEVVPKEMKANGCRWFQNVREYEYDKGFPAQFAGMLDCVNSMQEIADMFGCAVKNFDKYYLPQYFGRAVDEIVKDASLRCDDKLSGETSNRDYSAQSAERDYTP